MFKRLLLVVSLLWLVLWAPGMLHASNDTWVGGAAGDMTDWGTASNWSPLATPGTGDSVVFPVLSSSNAVELGASGPLAPSVASLNFTNSNYDLLIDSTSSLTTTGTGFINASFLSLVNNGTLNLNNSSTAGNATITNSSSGIIYFTGLATASAATLVNHGTFDMSGMTTSLTVGSLSDTSANPGAYNLGANNLTLGTLNGNDSIYGVISDGGLGGSLTKAGTGTLTLGGANSYTGNTTIEAGTIALGAANALPTGAVLIDLGTFDLNGFNQQVTAAAGTGVVTNSSGTAGIFTLAPTGSNTFGGTLTGNLGLTMDGTGTLTLTGNNSYTGPTTLVSGSLNADSSTALGTGTLVFDGGTFNGGPNLTLANNIFVGGPNVFITGNTYLTLAGGISLGGNNLIFGADGSAVTTTFSGQITGSGTLELESGTPSTLVLSNNNSFNGGILLNGGTLIAANSGALGSGNVAVNSGILMINGPRVLNIGGNYTQAAAGTLQLGLVTVSQCEALNIAGTATLAGTLVFNPGGLLFHDAEIFTIINAASVNGTFSSVSDSAGGDEVSLVYDPASVVLDAMANTLSFQALGLTPNQKAVGAALDTQAVSGGDSTLINYLDSQSNSSLPGMYDQISPSNLTPMFRMGFDLAQAQAEIIGQRLSQLWGSSGFSASSYSGNSDRPMFAGTMSASEEASMNREEGHWGAFADGLDNFGTVVSDGNGAGYQYSTGGTTAGLDYRFSKNFTGGLLLGYSQSGTSQSTGQVNVSGGQMGLYAGLKQDALRVEALAEGGMNNYTTQRTGLGGTAVGNTQGMVYSGELGAGYDFKIDQTRIGPFATGQWTQVNVDAFSESGSLAPLVYGAQSETSVVSDFGGQATRSLSVGGIKLSPTISAAWEHVYQGNLDALNASLGSGGSFTVNGPAMGTDGAVLSGGLNAEFDKGLDVYADYEGKVGFTNYTSQSFLGGVNLLF